MLLGGDRICEPFATQETDVAMPWLIAHFARSSCFLGMKGVIHPCMMSGLTPGLERWNRVSSTVCLRSRPFNHKSKTRGLRHSSTRTPTATRQACGVYQVLDFLLRVEPNLHMISQFRRCSAGFSPMRGRTPENLRMLRKGHQCAGLFQLFEHQ